jgi:hypothetical protein
MKIPVIIVFGCEGRDWDLHSEVIAFLKSIASEKSPGVYHYKKGKREYEIKVAYTKAEFKEALDTDDAFVVYGVHSRMGQGPAFGDTGSSHCPDPTTYPVNAWEDHFRMGYDAIDIPCVEEILGHCTNPKEISKGAVPKGFFVSPHVEGILAKAKGKPTKCKQKGYARRSLKVCYPTLANTTNGRGVKSLLSRDYWSTNKTETEFQTIIETGSKDILATKLSCRVLFMYSCLTNQHYYAALKRQKNRMKSKCIFFLSTRLTYDVPAPKIFLRLLLKGKDPTTKKGAHLFLDRINSLGLSAGKIIVRY